VSKTKKNSATRDPFDFYPTPEWCVHRFLDANLVYVEPEHLWFEPAAGSGAIIKAVNSWKVNDLPKFIATEIQAKFEPELLAIPNVEKVVTCDFTSTLPMLPSALGHKDPDVIITNPPFNKALEFAKRAIEYSPEHVCMLLRLNFLGSQERSSWLRSHTPEILVLPNRPSFTGKGTDSIEYAWFVWSKSTAYGSHGPGFIEILKDTPSSERNKGRTVRSTKKS